LKCQEQEAPYDTQDKDDGIMDSERWNWDEDWLPKIKAHSECSFADIIEKLREEYQRLKDYERFQEYDKFQDEYDYFGSEPSTIQMQAEDAGPAHSTGDTTVSFAPQTKFEPTDGTDSFVDNSVWDYGSNQMHIDLHSTGMALSSSSYPLHSGSTRQPVPSLPAGPSLFTDNNPTSSSIDPRLLHGNEAQNALISLTSPSAYGNYQSNQFVQSFNMNPVTSNFLVEADSKTQTWNYRTY
jgi:hypothetical protein